MIRVGMSTSCVYPQTPDDAFRLARLAGYDGVEVMITSDPTTQDAAALRELMREYELPVLSVHAPVLLFTQLVWGWDAEVKLVKSVALARELGASTVVVHPPFRWQATYARDFERIVRTTAAESGVEIAVENMFPWRVGALTLAVFAPSADPTLLDCDAMTLDFSHASLAARDSLELAVTMGPRLRHVHLSDGSGSNEAGGIFDQHLLPGHGTEPVAEVLKHLRQQGWNGSVIAEVNTAKAKSEQERLAMLIETLAFARQMLAPAKARPRRSVRR